ncbi:HalOD1 output domain-containing protein [Halolamina sp.]|jgi:hypothetical protein|uniref:HalOD1 output domain-containing protein n=1 Tax=Halolamina sp. TaxID=1940283 RepID=UPI003561B44B
MTPNPDNDDSSKHEAAAQSDEGSLPDQWAEIESKEKVESVQWVQVNQAHYDREDDGELVSALVMAIAEAKDVDPTDHTEMPPLYQSVDAAALEQTFFAPSKTGVEHQDGGLVTFQYNGYKVALRTDGWISVYEPR